MLVLDAVSRRFDNKLAVADVNLKIEPGSFVGVIGRSGAGKSTLLRMINRLLDPSEGGIHFDGVDVAKLRGKELRRWRARCAMIFQQFNLVGRLDVMTNVLMGRLNTIGTAPALLRLWREEDRAIALSALDQFDIAGIASPASRQPVGWPAAARRHRPGRSCRSPTSSSPTSRSPRSIRATRASSWMRCSASTSTTASPCCVTFMLSTSPREYCDRLVGMSAGRVVFDGLPSTLTEDVARELYGLEAGEVMEAAARDPVPEIANGAAVAMAS